MHDMDGQIAAEAELRKAKRIYDEVMRVSGVIVWTYDTEAHRADILPGGYNEEVCRRFGIPEVVDDFPRSFAGFVDERDRAAFLDACRSIDEGAQKAQCEFRYQMPGQKAVQWEYVVLSRAEGDKDESPLVSCFGQNITFRKQAQESYERTLRDILIAVPDALEIVHADLTVNVCDADCDTRVTEGGPILPLGLDALMETLAKKVPDDVERAGLLAMGRDALLEAFQEGRDDIHQEYRRLGDDGKLHWVSTHVRMLRNPQTDHVEGVVYTRDIAKKRRQEEISRIIMSASFDLVALIHLDTRKFEAVHLDDALPKAYRRLLPEPGAVCDFDAFCAESLLHMDAETREGYETKLSSNYIRNRLARGNGTYEFVQKLHFSDDGRRLMYRRLLHYALSDDPDTVLVIESDVTEEVLRQQRLLEKSEAEAKRDRKIMDSITVGIAELRLDDEGRLSVDSFNQHMFRILGYDPSGIPQRAEEAKGTPLEAAFDDALTYVHPDDKERVIRTFLEHRTDASFSIEPFRMIRGDGNCCWIAEDVRTSGHEQGADTYYATYRDVTWELDVRNELKQRLAEEQTLRIKADDANAAKSDFLSRMSHDMRTPLNGVIGMTYLAREGDNPPKTTECLDKIDTSAKFLLGLINDVLDMSKVESGKIELHLQPYPANEFNAYLDAVIRPLCEEKGQRFVLEEDVIADEVPLADKRCINQVLFNLLSNAVKFTPEGGTITYDVQMRKVSAGRVAVSHRIADTGVGMSREFMDRLFEPFSQEGRDDASEHRGSGLGLAIVKRFVDLMGGTIAVQSERGKGTVFTLDLEFDSIPTTSTDSSSSDKGAACDAVLSGKRMLLVEDHPLNQEIARALLEEKGIVVETADDGRTGLEMFARSAYGSYDAILMDIRMPVMDGYESSRAIRTLDRPDAATVPIVAMTADAFLEDVQRCLDAGMDAHIAKPIEPDVLFCTLRDVLSKRSGGRKGERES